MACRNINGKDEYWHIEAQISYRPIGYVGGNGSAKKRSPQEVKQGINEWVEKKFTSDKKVQKRKSIAPKGDWQFYFVYGELKDATELDYIKQLGVKPIAYKQILEELIANTTHKSSSAANNITEILKFIK